MEKSGKVGCVSDDFVRRFAAHFAGFPVRWVGELLLLSGSVYAATKSPIRTL